MNRTIPVSTLPTDIRVEDAVEAACSADITFIEEKLRRGVSVLVECDKELTLFLYMSVRNRLRRLGKDAPKLVLVDGRPRPDDPPKGTIARTMDQLTEAIRSAVDRTVIVIPHLDVLTTTHTGLTLEARESIPLLYENPEAVILGFRDPSFEVPKVIKEVFGAKREITGIPRDCIPKIITQREAKSMHPTEFDPFGMYKFTSGLNPVRCRRIFSELGVRREAGARGLSQEVYSDIRKQTVTDDMEVPNVDLEKDIGGYAEVKARLNDELIELIRRKETLGSDQDIQSLESLLPRGVIFYGPPGTGKCVAKGTRVTDAKTGFREPVEVIVGKHCDTHTLTENGLIQTTPSAWLSTGHKECIRLVTHVGHAIEVTPEHPMLTVDGWVPAGALRVGDHIAGARQIPFPEVTVTVPNHELILLGALVPDGCYSQAMVTYTKWDPGTVSVVANAVKAMGGTLEELKPHNYRVRTHRDGNGFSDIRKLLLRNGMGYDTAHFKHMPSCVFQLGPEQLAIFIGSLWSGDGEVEPTTNSLCYGSMSHVLVEELHHLLLRLGIQSNVGTKPVKYKDSILEYRVLTILASSRKRFVDLIPLYGRKAEELKKFRFFDNPNDDLVPLTPILEARFRASWNAYLANGGRARTVSDAFGRKGKMSPHSFLSKKNISRKTLETWVTVSGDTELGELLNVRWERVTSKDFVGVKEVYDLSIERTHNFIANDLVAHNTFFAKAIATALNATVIVVSGPELKSKWVGESEENLRRIFRQARQAAPAVIIFDEIDAFAHQRGTYVGSGVEHSMVNQLLTEMDGFRKNEMIFVVGTTNYLESLDGALMRPGRFEFMIEIPAPTAIDREAITRIYDKKFNLGMSDDVVKHLVRRTEGMADREKNIPFSGDHLYSVCRALKRQGLRTGSPVITNDDIDKALQRKTRRQIVLGSSEERVIAVHEAGHALVAMLCPKATPPEKISISSDIEGALGYVMRAARTRPYAITEAEMRADICVGLGGQVAERMVFGEITVGAYSDLQSANSIARAMVEQYGMSETMGPRVVIEDETGKGGRSTDPERQRKVDAEIDRLLREEKARAEKLLLENRALHQALVDLLLEKKVLETAEIAGLTGGK